MIATSDKYESIVQTSIALRSDRPIVSITALHNITMPLESGRRIAAVRHNTRLTIAKDAFRCVDLVRRPLYI